jgi:alginate O-acetyltransferase complex protein AlgI
MVLDGVSHRAVICKRIIVDLTSFTFAGFVLVVWVGYWSVAGQRQKNWVLLVSSLVFAGVHWPAQAVLSLLWLGAVFGLGRILENRGTGRGWALSMGLILCVGMLAYFKYANGAGVGGTAGLLGFLGISYITFRCIHYLLDLANGRIDGHSALDFLVYVLFFPTLVSGPIERFKDFSANRANALVVSDIADGAGRILIGLGKKFVIADSLDYFVATYLVAADGSPMQVSAPLQLVGIYAYSLKLYFDFSAYSDMAIGLARLFGFRIGENFNWPYLQRNITSFWQNWHISLSNWLRDYVFTPLARSSMAAVGRSYGKPVMVCSHLVTMGICGIWHGAGWGFLVWGLYHGAGLASHQLYREFRSKLLPKSLREWSRTSGVMACLSGLATFHFVTFGWIFFAFELDAALQVWHNLLSGGWARIF